jgi:hypothetical protein
LIWFSATSNLVSELSRRISGISVTWVRERGGWGLHFVVGGGVGVGGGCYEFVLGQSEVSEGCEEQHFLGHSGQLVELKHQLLYLGGGSDGGLGKRSAAAGGKGKR